MDNPVNIYDLEPRFRPLSEAEGPNAQSLLDDAWAELQARVPQLAARTADGLVSTALIRRVVTAMAVRVLRNPDSIRQWSIDDGSFTRDQLVSSGLLFATDDEVALLSGTAAAAGSLPPLSFSASLGYGR